MKTTLAIAEEKWAREMKTTQESFEKRNNAFAASMKVQMESQENAFESQIKAQQEATEKLCTQVAFMHSEMGELKKLITEVKSAITSNQQPQTHQRTGYQYNDKWQSMSPELIKHYTDAAFALARQGTHATDTHDTRQVTPPHPNGQIQNQPQGQ
jgi:hypothetical protein